ncbi:hypothetical protein Syun_022745 [Stephania yunnanensis]|uniref:Uncharacterized protein n=1 Tax=Stephania yunnanensis TaxID=152371 RepID=A0AAP0FLL1_9MAGN
MWRGFDDFLVFKKIISPPNNPKSHGSRSPQNPQIPSRLALALGLETRGVWRASATPPTPPSRPSATKTPKIPSRLALCSPAETPRSVARVGDSGLRRLRGLPATKTPKSLLVSLSALRLETCGVWRAWLGDSSYAAFAAFLRPKPPNPFSSRSLLSGSRPAECGARGSATPAYAAFAPSRLAIVLGSFMGTDDSKSRARLGSAQGSSSLFDKAGVSLFLRSSSSSSRFTASSADSRCFEPQFRMISILGSVMGLKLKLGAKIRIQRFGFWVVLIFLGNSGVTFRLAILAFSIKSQQSCVTLSIGDWFFDRVGVSAIDCPYPRDNTAIIWFPKDCALCGKANSDVVKEVALVLKAFYDANVLEEEFIMQCYNEILTDVNKTCPIWKNEKSFIEWPPHKREETARNPQNLILNPLKCSQSLMP